MLKLAELEILDQYQRRPKAIIFDLDGTILDTLGDLALAGNTLLAKHNWATHPVEAYKLMVGNGFKVLIQRLLPEQILANLSQDDLRDLASEGWSYYVNSPNALTHPYAGMAETLLALQNLGQNSEYGLQLAVLSNKPHEMTVQLVGREFKDIHFAEILGGGDLPLKPAPDMANYLLQKLNLKASHCWFVGDSSVDMNFAHNTGMLPLAVDWGFRSIAELTEAKAPIILENPSELLELFQQTF